MEALRRGYRVTGIDRNRAPAGEVECILADVRDRAHIERLVKDHDCVTHLAAVTSSVEFIKNPMESDDTNVTGFLNVIDAACAKRAATSSCMRRARPFTRMDFSEDVVIDVNRQGNHYAKSKAHCVRGDLRDAGDGSPIFNVYGNGGNEKGDYASIGTIFLKSQRRASRSWSTETDVRREI